MASPTGANHRHDDGGGRRQQQNANDASIIATANDAAVAKRAAVQAGYLQDPYIAALVPAAASSPHRTVQPIIKRGTFARICVMDRALRSFINLFADEPDLPLQILILGSGKDTSFFRYADGSIPTMAMHSRARWYEVDHDLLLSDKVKLIGSHSEIFQQCATKVTPTLATGGWTMKAVDAVVDIGCDLIPHDLRQPTVELFDKLHYHGFDNDRPTLIVLECVQMYLPDEACQALLETLGTTLSRAFVATYEPILLDDAFGRVMEQNLRQARLVQDDCCLVTCRTLAAQMTKLRQAGLGRHQGVTGCTMQHAYDTVVTAAQRRTASQAEFLDELEEWMLILRHYCVVIASNDDRVGAQFCAIGKGSAMGFEPGKCEQL